jgi:hypothetical protein
VTRQIDKLIAGLSYLAAQQERVDFSCEHDVLHVGSGDGFTSADRITMEKLGFVFDEQFDCWAFLT